MKAFTRDDVEQLSHDFLLQEDDRPQMLKDMTSIAEPTERYNRFLYQFSELYERNLILETGTDRGRSAAHFALGCPESLVITVDIDPACGENVDQLKIRNILSISGESLGFAPFIREGILDVLFLDSLHTYDHTMGEWRAYRPKVKKGGIIFIDDITLDAGMSQFWSEVEGDKFDLSHLHCSGFGAVIL